MARGGSKKGERRGGRIKGIPNRATIERVILAEREIAEKQAVGKKLGKEVLEDFTLLFAGMAAHYQPAPPGSPPNQYEDEDKFYRNAGLAVDCAHKLAPYQSPTFRAIMVAPAPDANQPEKRKRFTLTVFEGGKPAPPAEITPLRSKGG